MRVLNVRNGNDDRDIHDPLPANFKLKPIADYNLEYSSAFRAAASSKQVVRLRVLIDQSGKYKDTVAVLNTPTSDHAAYAKLLLPQIQFPPPLQKGRPVAESRIVVDLHLEPLHLEPL
jgi:hypothetical protein